MRRGAWVFHKIFTKIIKTAPLKNKVVLKLDQERCPEPK